ncbi:uncharacterized protein TNCV_4757821 [Trichonephila clavipes]|nr:uncharacterized protein TNCV_4757821 [Trichonephila clavipes]
MPEIFETGRKSALGEIPTIQIDEKLFTVQQVHNSQNDRLLCVDASSTSVIVKHRQYPNSVKVWGGIRSSGKTPLVFVEDSVKINQKVYRRDIFEALVLRGTKGTSEIQNKCFNKTTH